jgi:UDP:flavonoid glycosyltransferase YjiC (YdhE family)
MRILFTCVPGMAHLNAMLPVLSLAADQGHEVAVATARTFGAEFAKHGYQVLPSGKDWSQADPSSLPALHSRKGPAQLAAFAEVAGMGMVDDLLVHAKEFRPDVIVWDAMEFGGWVAGELLGIPTAAIASAMGTPRPIMAALAGEAVQQLAAQYDLEPDPELRRMFSHLYLHRKPRSLDLPYADPLKNEFRFRPAMFDAPAVQGARESEDKPLVHLSLGTTFIGSDSARTVNEIAIAALADEAIRLVVTIGRHADPASYGTLPANTELVPYANHPELLPRCSAFLCQGSFSSVLVAIASGVPMGFLPMGADQLMTSMHLSNLGLGVNLANVFNPPVPSLDASKLRGDEVVTAVRSLLDKKSYADAVAYIGEDYRALPALPAVIDRLERLAEEERTDDRVR